MSTPVQKAWEQGFDDGRCDIPRLVKFPSKAEADAYEVGFKRGQTLKQELSVPAGKPAPQRKPVRTTGYAL